MKRRTWRATFFIVPAIRTRVPFAKFPDETCVTGLPRCASQNNKGTATVSLADHMSIPEQDVLLVNH